jgi:hypothetical protein
LPSLKHCCIASLYSLMLKPGTLIFAMIATCSMSYAFYRSFYRSFAFLALKAILFSFLVI